MACSSGVLVWYASDGRPEIRALAFAPQHIRSFAFEYRNCVPRFRIDRASSNRIWDRGHLPSSMLFFLLNGSVPDLAQGSLQRIGWTPKSTRLSSTPDFSQ